MITEHIILVVIIALLASTVKSAFGFGEGMVNMSLLSLFLPLEISVPYVAFISATGSSYITIKERKQIDWNGIKILVISSLLMTPIGIWVGKVSDTECMKIFLGLIISVFSVYSIFKPDFGKLYSAKNSWIFGGIGGILAGAYNVSGPPVAIYGNLRSWPAPIYRVNLQCFFSLTSLGVLTGHIFVGNFNLEILKVSSLSLPFVLLGIIIGKQINLTLKNPLIFKRTIYLLLFFIGMTLTFG